MQDIETLRGADRLIREANELGDRYRDLVRRRLKEAGLPPDQPMCPALDRILRKSYREVYRK